MLEFTHDYRLVLVSLAVALMAGFTGLSLTRGASDLAVPHRKLVVAMSAVALGGGIWSMHFVAMLGLQLPILFYYDTLITLISALVAILIAGIALLILHFGERTGTKITSAGIIIGIGIPIMHYIGMSGMELCRAVYTPLGVILALIASIFLSVAAVWIAYSKRGAGNIVLGTMGFGFAVFAVHFLAMAGTGFIATDQASHAGTLMSNETLAIGVTISAFVISGAFLLTGVTFAPALDGRHKAAALLDTPAKRVKDVVSSNVPYEKDGRTHFVRSDAIAAVQAEGHYTVLYVGPDKFFCPWSISDATKRLSPDQFIQSHRSYLVNASHISGFERTKDTGIVFFDQTPSLGKVPVSRSRLPFIRDALGL